MISHDGNAKLTEVHTFMWNENLKSKMLQVPRNEEYIRSQKSNSFARRTEIWQRRLKFHPRSRVRELRTVARSRVVPTVLITCLFYLQWRESARSTRWAEVGTHHPQSEKPPLLIRVHPHYMLAAPSTTPQLSGRGPFAREQKPFSVRTCVCVCVRARTTHLHAFVLSSHRRWTLRKRKRTRTYNTHAATYEVQKGRDWQCRGPTCPLPQHGHAPRGSTWPFSSSGWCATVKPALRILRGTHTAGAAMQQINPTLRIHTCALDGARMLALLGSRWCATIFFSRTII